MPPTDPNFCVASKAKPHMRITICNLGSLHAYAIVSLHKNFSLEFLLSKYFITQHKVLWSFCKSHLTMVCILQRKKLWRTGWNMMKMER